MRLQANPPRHHQTPGRRTASAIGLGVGVAGIGLTIGDIYRRPSIALGGMVLGIGLTALHLPWADLLQGGE